MVKADSKDVLRSRGVLDFDRWFLNRDYILSINVKVNTNDINHNILDCLGLVCVGGIDCAAVIGDCTHTLGYVDKLVGVLGKEELFDPLQDNPSSDDSPKSS